MTLQLERTPAAERRDLLREILAIIQNRCHDRIAKGTDPLDGVSLVLEVTNDLHDEIAAHAAHQARRAPLVRVTAP